MYKIIFTKKAKKQIKKLNNIISERIIATIERIQIRPFNFIKKLGGTPLYVLRVGDYRIILDVRKTELIILVLEIGHRKNIYKK